MALSFNPLIYVNPGMSMGSLNTHAQAVGGRRGPRGRRGMSWTDRQSLAWKTALIFDLIREPSLKQRHIVGSWLCALCLVCVRMWWREDCMYDCMCVRVSLWVLSTHLLVCPGPLFASLLLAGLPVWETPCLKRPAEGFKDRVGRGKVMNI